MIHGIIAQCGGSGTGGPVPVTILDFAAGAYSDNGVTLAASAVVDNVGRISGSGLEDIAGSPVQILNAVLARLLLINWTVVIEFNSPIVEDGDNIYLLTLWDAVFDCQVALYLRGDARFFEDDGNGTSRFLESGNSCANGINKIAWTRTDAGAAMSLNGGSVVSDATTITAGDYLNPLTQVLAAEGDNPPTHEGFIRKISIYAPQIGAALPALSAL